MEQHPVPQHMASFEFKLFGNLTVRQFVSLSIPMAIAAIIFFSGLPPFVRLPISLVIGLFGLFIALVPVQGRSFDKWIVAFIKAIMSPTQRIWVKEIKIPEFLSIVIAPHDTELIIPESITAQGRKRLAEYLRSLPKTSDNTLDKREQIALQNLGLTYETPTGTQKSQNAPILVDAPAALQANNYIGRFRESLPPIEIGRTQAIHKTTPINRAFTLPGLEKKAQRAQDHIELINFPKLEPKARLASDLNSYIENIIPLHTPDHKITLVPGIGRIRVRKLHFGPPQNPSVTSLKIIGENQIEYEKTTSEPLLPNIVEVEKPANLLQQSENTLREVPALLPITHAPDLTQDHSKETPHIIQRTLPKSTVITGKAQDVVLKVPTQPLIDQKITINAKEAAIQPSTPVSRAQIIPLTDKPNVLSGVVSLSDSTPLEGAILIVHDQHRIPVRALKTNKLGQFLSATPLTSGQYEIEVESALASFLPITINLKDKVLDPMEIKAKGDS